MGTKVQVSKYNKQTVSGLKTKKNWQPEFRSDYQFRSYILLTVINQID
jgi:hypothetical protein